MGNTESVAVGSIDGKNKSYQEIINSKSFLKKIIENMADGVSIVYTDGMHIDVNAAFCKMTGYSKQELIGTKPPHPYWPKEEYESIQQAFQKTMQGEVKDFSLIFKRKNGERFPVLVSPSLVKDSSGDVACYYATVKDISQFQKLKDDKTIILNAMNELFCYYNPDLKILWGNKAAADSVGMNAEDLVGKHCYELWNQSDQPCDDCPVLKSYETGKPESVERKTPDGRYWRLYGYPIFDRDGSIKNLVELGLDITEKKKTEIALKENMEKYHTLFETMAQGVVYQNAEGKIISANPEAERILGLSLSQMQGRTSLDPRWKAVDKHKHELSGENHPAMIALKTGEKVTDFLQGVFNPKKNDYVWIIVNAVPQFKDGSETPYQVYSTFLDVTDRVNAEQNMEESEKKFKKLFENSQNGIVLCQLFKDEQGNPIDYIHLKVNPATEKHLGYKPETLINKTATDLIGEKAGRLYAEKNGKCVITGEPYSWVDFTPVYNKYLKMDSYQIKDDYFAITFVDISKEKLALKKIEESEQKFRQTFEQSTVGYSLTRPDGELMEINQAFASMLGYTVEELSHKNFVDITHPEDIAESKECMRCLLSGGKDTYTLEKRYFHRNGDIVWALVSTVLLKDTENKPVHLITSIQDITKQKHMERELKSSERKLSMIFENKGTAVGTFADDGVITLCNSKFVELSGYTKDEIIGHMKWSDFVRDEDLERMSKYHKKRSEGEKPPSEYECDIITKNDERRTVLVNIGVIPETKERIVSLVDITSLKQTENKLKKTSNHLQKLISASPSAIMTVDIKGKITSWNPASEQIFGWKKDEIIGRFNPTVPDQLKEIYFQTIKETHVNLQHKVLRKDGSFVDISLSTTPLYDDTGSFSGALGIMTDITKEKQAEEQAKKAVKEKELLLKSSSNGIRVITKDFKVKLMNQTMADIAQTTEEEGIGMKCSEMFPSKWCGTDHCSMKRILRGGTGFVEEKVQKTKDGKEITFLASVNPYVDKQGHIIGIIEDFRDISLVKEAEKELEQAHNDLQKLNRDLELKVNERTQRIQQLLQQKDEFINQLGHDLKNPLGPLTQLLPLVEKHVDDPKYNDMLQVAIRNTRYMKQLVTKTIQLAQLKSPNTELNYESLNLCDELYEIIETNQLMLKENQIKVQNNLPESLTVHADKLKIHEVFNNLLNNAVKYTDEKPGCITIDSSLKDDVIAISIKDSGIGMTSEQLDKVFDEFYKADSSRHDFDSSGLGMPICKRIIEMHGGRIWAESDGLGKGSTFYFSLPKS